MVFLLKAWVTGYCSRRELEDKVKCHGGVILSVSGINVDENFNPVTILQVNMSMVDEGVLEDAQAEFCRKFPGCDVRFID